MALVTIALLRHMGVAPKLAEAWADALAGACARYGIDTPTRVEDFIAQVLHESRLLTALEENLNYTTPTRLVSVWPTRFSSSTKTTKKRYAGDYVRNPQKLAEFVYGGRMGNGPEGSGDGWKFHGRAPLMMTGFEMYDAYRRYSGHDVVNNPDLLKTPEIGADSAGWVFAVEKSLLDEADLDQELMITRKINGGTIGLDERRKLTEKVREYLNRQTADVVVQQAIAEAVEPDPVATPVAESVEPAEFVDQSPVEDAPVIGVAGSLPVASLPKRWVNPLDWLAGKKTHIIAITGLVLSGFELFGYSIPDPVYQILLALGGSTLYRGMTRHQGAV